MQASAHSRALGDAAPIAPDLISTGEVVRILGVHPNTVRLWCETGQLTAYRLGSGHRRFSRSQVLSYAYGEEPEAANNVVILYGRCSTAKQRDSLKGQMDRLRAYAAENFKGFDVIEYEDLGSGMNLQRKNLTQLLGRILKGEFNGATLVVEHKDRLARWATDLILLICRYHSVKVVFVEQQECTDEEMLANDLMSIIHIFSCKSYSRCSSAARATVIPAAAIARAKELLDTNVSIQGVADRLHEEGYRGEDGERLTYSIIRRQVFKNRGRLEKVLPKRDSSAEEFIRACVTKGEANLRLPQKILFEHYANWCKSKGKVAAAKRLFFAYFTDYEMSMNFRNRCYCGMKVKGLEKETFTAARRESRITPTGPTDAFLNFYSGLGHFSGSYSDLKKLYLEFCQKEGAEPLTRIQMEATLRRLGAKVRRTRSDFCVEF